MRAGEEEGFTCQDLLSSASKIKDFIKSHNLSRENRVVSEAGNIATLLIQVYQRETKDN